MSRGELGLSDIGGVLNAHVSTCLEKNVAVQPQMWSGVFGYLVSLMSCSGSFLSLIARGKLGKIAMVITFPISLRKKKISKPPRSKRGEPLDWS